MLIQSPVAMVTGCCKLHAPRVKSPERFLNCQDKQRFTGLTALSGTVSVLLQNIYEELGKVCQKWIFNVQERVEASTQLYEGMMWIWRIWCTAIWPVLKKPSRCFWRTISFSFAVSWHCLNSFLNHYTKNEEHRDNHRRQKQRGRR